MKIALVSPFSLKQNQISGGVAAVTQFLSDALINDGHEVHVIAPGNAYGQLEKRGALTIHWVGLTSLPGFLVYAFSQRQQIFTQLKKIAPDVVHFEGSFGWSIHCPYPFVVTIHGIAEKDAGFSGNPIKRFISSNWIKMCENRGRRIAPSVISISPYATDMLKENLGGTVDHIPNPIDASLFELASTEKQREDKLVCVGIVGERKNTLGVIEAFANIKPYYPALTLTICGQAVSQEYLDQCHQLVKKLGLVDDIEFTGNLAREALYHEFMTARGLLMMSRQETAPMAIAEAMVLGVPCIAPAEFGIPYMIDEGKNGWFVSENTKQEKWQEIAQNLMGEQWAALSGHAREAAQQYHPNKVAQQTLEIYRQVINAT